MLAGQKARTPEPGEDGLVGLIAAPLADQDDKPRQVLVFAAQAVAEPGAHAGPAGLLRAGLEKVMAGSWLIASVFMILMRQMSSTIEAVCGSNSLTQAPHFHTA